MIAPDVERHRRACVSRIDGDDQVHRNMFVLEHFGERQGTEPAHRMADQSDGGRIVAVVTDSLCGDQPADRELVDIRLDAGV